MEPSPRHLLRESYNEIFEEMKDLTSYNLLEIAVDLCCINYICEDKILTLNRRFNKNKNIFSLEILRNFVCNYLYLHGCSDFRMQQRLCNELGISSKKLLLNRRKQAKFSI